MKKIFQSSVILVSLFSLLSFSAMSQCTPDAGVDQVVCGVTVSLLGSIPPSGTQGYWTGPDGVFFSPADTIYNAIAVIQPYTTAHNETFRWHYASQTCNDSDAVIIFFQPFSGQTMVSAGFDIVTCDTFAQLHGIVQPSTFGTGHWTTFNNVVIDSSLDPDTYIRFQPDAGTYNCDSSKFTVTMNWTVSNGANCSATDNVKITFYQTPHANAGFTDNHTNLASCELTTHSGAIPSICASYGSWDIASAPAGCTGINFSDLHGPGSSVQVGCYGIYEFVWFEQNIFNTQCGSHDTVIIEFIEKPNLSAGTDQWVCGGLVHLDATPSGSSAGQSWLQAPVNWLDSNFVNDPSQITNPDAIADHFQVSNSSIAFVWSEYNESTIPLPYTLQCLSRDTVIVYFFNDQSANDLVNFADTFQCGNIFPNLVAAPPQEGYGFWVDTSFASTFFSQNTYPDNLHDSVIVSDYGMHHLFWIIKNGERPDGSAVCIDSSDVVPIRFIEYPDAEILAPFWEANPVAGSEIKWDTICGPEYSLEPDTNSPGIYIWFTYNGGNMFFTSNGQTSTTELFDTVLTEIYNSDIGTPSYYEVYLSIDNSVLPAPVYSHGCIDRDTIRITFAQRPSGEILAGMPGCFGEAAPVSAANDLPGKPVAYEWYFSGGQVDSVGLNVSTPDNTNDSVYHVSWGTTGGDQFHTISLITRNSWGCASQMNIDTIFEPLSIVNGIVTVQGGVLPAYSAKIEFLNPVNGAILYSHVLDSSMFFHFEVITGQYLLHVKITNDTLDNILSTYYNQALIWSHADLLTFSCDSTYYITFPMAVAVHASGSPSGSLSGSVTYDTGAGGKGVHTGKSVTGEPVPGAEIFVELEPDDDPIANTTTDDQGFFTQAGLPEGHSYSLSIDIPGIPMVTTYENLNISGSQTSYTNLNFVVDTTAGEGIYISSTDDPDSEKSVLKIYPNPAKDLFYITYTGKNDKIISGEIFDVSGKKVADFSNQNTSSTSPVNIKKSGMVSGIYWVKTLLGQTIYIKKLVVE